MSRFTRVKGWGNVCIWIQSFNCLEVVLCASVTLKAYSHRDFMQSQRWRNEFATQVKAQVLSSAQLQPLLALSLAFFSVSVQTKA